MSMTGLYLPVTIVNHAAIDIAVPPDRVWRLILEHFVDAQRWRELGYCIEPLDDPAAVFGSYRMWLEQDDKVVDNRVCHITEIDDSARRLSLFADYLSQPGGAQVYVTYQAQEIAGATRYTMDCHTRAGIDASAKLDKASVATAIAAIKSHSDTHLAGFLARIKTRLEGTE
ncbi:SRPBCC family protein [Steroidobacter sp.]|uniref:SRPBCC family protein n=1 Tax=Steroidobacter sp. TaxID=1978227 RepID=UPI001A4B9E0F|nr:SRPBCC family protein [Steroidobacter sp.]MBL8269642.1 SRPBCC family protein [Steroidobacter sp.]